MSDGDDESEESLLRRFEAEQERERACLVRIARKTQISRLEYELDLRHASDAVRRRHFGWRDYPN